MARVTKIEIRESVEELHELLRKQKTVPNLERIQVLYLLKTGKVKTISEVAVVLGRTRVTVQRWLKKYQESGIKGLLTQKKSPGRPAIISGKVREKLEKELQESAGFKSYQEIKTWLKAVEGIDASYKVVHDPVRYQMKAKLKVPRAVGIKYDKEAELDFKKNCQNT